MKIIFVRHGHPDYAHDCLTELGHLQAEAAAERLSDREVDAIFASSCGRAKETAEHIANKLGLKVECLDFMREISWGTESGEELYLKGHPWRTADKMIEDGQSVVSYNWQSEEPFKRNTVKSYINRVNENFDAWLAELGFLREGDFYRIKEQKYGTIILVSHGGSSGAVLSHVLNLPFTFICASVRPNFTAITELSLTGEVGTLTTPRIEILNDARHIKGLETENVIEK